MKRHLRRWILLGLLLWVWSANAQTDAQPTASARKGPQFAAVVQYQSGTTKVRNFRKQVLNLEFKDVIAESETVLINEDSTLKLVTANRCVLVLYGKALLKAPKSTESPWQLRGGSVRVICPEGQAEKLQIGKETLEVRGGELFIHDQKLIVLKEEVTSDSNPLQIRHIYTRKGGSWQTDEKQTDPTAIYEFHLTRQAPVESAGIEKPEGYDEKEKTAEEKPKELDRNRTRWGVLTLVGGSRREFKNKELSEGDMHTDGISINRSQPLPNGRSLLIRFGHREYDHEWRGGPTDTGHLNFGQRGDGFELMTGLRANHTKWWSFYGLAGLGWHNLHGEYFDQFHSLSIESEMLAAHLALGTDVLYHPFRSFGLGLRLGLEFHYAHGITILSEHVQGFRNSASGGRPPLVDDMQDTYNVNGLQFQLGLFYYF